MTTFLGARAAATAGFLLLFSAACAAQNAGAAPGNAGPGEYANGSLALRVDYTGGFVTPTMLLTRLPAISVYGDGRVITQGPIILPYPGPALSDLQVQTISTADVNELVEQAVAAGVGTATDLGTPLIADASSTRFTLWTESGTEVFEVYALDEATGLSSGLNADQQVARDKLRVFAESVTDLSALLGDESLRDAEPYSPTAIAAIAEPWAAGDEGIGDQPEVAWPGPELPGESIGGGLNLGCVTVTGDVVRELVEAVASATTATPWTSGGERWTISLRPLLPHETGCADLTASAG